MWPPLVINQLCPKCQNFPTQSPIVRTSRKRPALVGDRGHFLGWRIMWCLFVCCMYKATQSIQNLCVTAWNYSRKSNLQIACHKIYSLLKSRCVGSFSQKRTPVAWFSLANTFSQASTQNFGIWGDRLWEVQRYLLNTGWCYFLFFFRCLVRPPGY